MGSCMKTEYTELRKEKFLNGFLELLMEKPYDQITVRDLCEYWKISRKTFYRYFSNKETALSELVDLVLLNIGGYTPPVNHSGDPVLDEMVRYFYYWSDNRRVLHMLLDNSLMEMLLFRSVYSALSEIDFFQKRLRHLDAQARESVAAYFVGGGMSVLLYWMRNGFSETPEQIAQRLICLVRTPGKFFCS